MATVMQTFNQTKSRTETLGFAASYGLTLVNQLGGYAVYRDAAGNTEMWIADHWAKLFNRRRSGKKFKLSPAVAAWGIVG